MRIALPIMTALVWGQDPCNPPEETITEVSWSGWVLSDLPAEDGNVVLETGALEITDRDGEHLTDGNPNESSPGYFSMAITPDTEIGIRITGDTVHPTVWRTRTPRADGYWLYGSLFGVDIESLALTLGQIEDLTDSAITWADAPAGPLIYGMPTLRDEADQEAWTGAAVTALGGDGQAGTVHLIAQDLETGATGLAAGPTGLVGANQVSGPIVLFVALDLAPGPVTLIVEGSDGRVAVADWAAEDGDVLSAFHLTLPERN